MTRKICLLLILSCFICFTGCGKNKELEIYSEEVTLFNETVSGIIDTMNHIDTKSDTAQDELLSCLDRMQEEFERFSNIEEPKKFENIDALSQEASVYMTESVRLYHEVFEAEEYQEEKAKAANDNYTAAMQRISYISTLLQGELPEGENISISDENGPDFTPIEEE